MLYSNSSHVVNSRDTWHSIEIGEHARVQREEIEAFHSARSKEFPTPIVNRAKRIHAYVYSPNNGRHHLAKNAIIHQPPIYASNHDLPYPVSNIYVPPSNVGYCLKRKLSKSVYGYVYKGIILKRRKVHVGEEMILNNQLIDGSERRHLETARIGSSSNIYVESSAQIALNVLLKVSHPNQPKAL